MNSFTFKNPVKTQCFHDGDSQIMLVIYKHWHWSYNFSKKQLDVWFATSPVKWTTNMPVTDFSIKVQTPIYFKDGRSSIKGKPVYEKQHVDWTKDRTHCVSFKIAFWSNYFNISFSEEVDNLYGDDIIVIVETMRGFFAEFREHLKTIKSFDETTVDNILKSMDCRLCKFGVNNSVAHNVRDEKIPERYTILPAKTAFYEETIVIDPLPF